SILDDRTTEFCSTANGRTWDANDPAVMQFIPPNHWHCRALMDVIWWDAKNWRNPPPESLSPPEGFGQLGMAA
ncbi:MAG: hypothetical protein U9Q07_00415, partial [Planctomycetota bacterium]|nr:hypothetical protein [Planctomycetota bacterium]